MIEETRNSQVQGNGFDPYYVQNIYPDLKKMENKRKGYLNILVITLFLCLSISVAIALSFFNHGNRFDSRYTEIVFLIIIVTWILPTSIITYYIHRFKNKVKLTLVEKTLNFIGWEYRGKLPEYNQKTMSLIRLPEKFNIMFEGGLLKKPDKVKVEDLVKGQISDIPFTICEVNMKELKRLGRYKVYQTTFKGCLLRCDLGKFFSGTTVLARNAGWLSPETRDFRGQRLKRTRLSSIKFEKLFDVYTTDQVEARYLLTPDIIENINTLQSLIGGRSFIAIFHEQSFFIAFEQASFFELKSYFIPLSSREHTRKLVNELLMIQDIVFSVNGRKNEVTIENIFGKYGTSFADKVQVRNKSFYQREKQTGIIKFLLQYFRP